MPRIVANRSSKKVFPRIPSTDSGRRAVRRAKHYPHARQSGIPEELVNERKHDQRLRLLPSTAWCYKLS